jgi:hypothetical protein
MHADFLALLCCLALPASAATVSTGPLVTGFLPLPGDPPVSGISESDTVTIDLSDLTGLLPGQDIQISFTTGEELYWEGGVLADEGDLTLQWQALLTLSVGSGSAANSESWSLGPVPWIGGSFSGYEFGPLPGGFALIVPWGTDLSSVSLTLTDQFSVDGRSARVLNSELTLADAMITTTSIPEPSSILLALMGISLSLRRRMRFNC